MQKKNLKFKVSKNNYATDKDKNNQIHSQIKIHNAHLNNNKFGKYKTEHDGAQSRHEHY